MIRVQVHALTDVGQKRKMNEDSHAWWIPEKPEDLARRGVLLVVADGMGGARAGERASRLAVDTVLSHYTAPVPDGAAAGPAFEDTQPAPGIKVAPAAGPAPALLRLKESVELANKAIHDESSHDPALTGMGTTCTTIAVLEATLLVAHVGDSRAYLIRGGSWTQLTADHSLVAQLVASHQLTPEEAKVDPRRNVVTRSVGVSANVQVDALQFEGVLQPGDTILLCSDGLHGQVTDDEMALVVDSVDPADACRRLVALANERGGPDNITVLLARIEDDSSRSH